MTRSQSGEPPIGSCLSDQALLELPRLSADERQAVEQHLKTCEACAKAARLLALQSAHGTNSAPAASSSALANTAPSDREAGPIAAPRPDERVFLATEGRYQHPPGGLVELGAGGLGRVLAVRDLAFGREVALKEIGPVPVSARSAAGARFLREARLAGQLEHPGIVPVYDFARDSSGRLFYVMRKIVGRTLAELIAEATVLRERLALVPHVLAMAQAVAYAHSRGVLHRDIKPQNVMVGPFGETLLLDWGLARRKSEPGAVLAAEPDDEPTLSRKGAPLGTPAYMSPEQAQGRLDEVDERSDVWMLGAVLFEVVTGRPPYSGTLAAVLTKARTGAVPALAEVWPGAPKELAAVVSKCLAKDRADRYPAVALLVKDLEAWLSGRLVSAHDYSPTELARRFVRRFRLPLAVSATAALALLAALATVEVRVRQERDDYRELSSIVLTEAVEAIRQTPGKRHVVVKLANKVRETFERGTWLRASTEDRRALHDAVLAAGRAQLEAGSLAEAEQTLRYAIPLSDSLVKDEPSVARLAEGAHDRTTLAATLHPRGRLAEAQRWLDEALKLAERARALAPQDAAAANAEDVTLSLMIAVATAQGRYLEAIPLAERGLEAERVALAGKVLRARDHYNRVVGHGQLAEVYEEAGQHERAVAASGRALEALAAFEQEYPSSLDYLDAVQDARQRSAMLELAEGRRDRALEQLALAGRAMDRLLEAEPTNADYLSRRIVVDFYRGSLEGMRAGLQRLEVLPSLEAGSDLVFAAMLVVWPPERALSFSRQHPELATKGARLHLALAAALAGQTGQARAWAQALAEGPPQPLAWSSGLVEQRLVGWEGPQAEAVRQLARAFDASVAPRDPARRREALLGFVRQLGALAADGG